MGHQTTPRSKNVILLISDIPEDLQFTKGILSRLDLELIHPVTEDRFIRSFEKGQAPVILVDLTTPETCQAFRNFASRIKPSDLQKTYGNNIHLIHSTETMKIPDSLDTFPPFGSFITRRNKNLVEEGARFSALIEAASLSPSKSAGSLYLLPSATKVENITLTHSSQKQMILEKVSAFITAEGFPERTISTIVTGADEILMNAIYDAHEDATPGRVELPRNTELQLENDRGVEVTLACDNQVFGVTVTDHVGSLNKTKLLRHLLQDFSKETYSTEQKIHRAGLGVGAIFRMGGSLVFICQPNKKTAVSVFFRKTENFRDFRVQFKHVSIIMDLAGQPSN